MSQSAQIFISPGSAGLSGIARDIKAQLGVQVLEDGGDIWFRVNDHRVFATANDTGLMNEYGVEIVIDRASNEDAKTGMVATGRMIFDALKATGKYPLLFAFDFDEVLDEFHPGRDVDTFAAMEKTIGTATLAPDGSIVMRLRAEGPGGMVGHGSLTIAPADHDYGSVLSHIGGLAPGETKLVAPFPAPDSK